jgi:NAD(P)-dependent dehydrogenase (short-subunit alcohol dehydrogenase family)
MSFSYNPDKDIPDLSGKVFLITGGASPIFKPQTSFLISPTGTAGVGAETLTQLSKHNPAHIYFTGRNASSAQTLIDSLTPTYKNLTFIPMDQTSLSSVSSGTKSFLEKSGNKLDVLICNAGIMAVPPATSKDRYEIQFAVNHLAHALIIKLCLPALQRAAAEKGDARIVSLTSLGFKTTPAGGVVFKDLKSDQSNLGTCLSTQIFPLSLRQVPQLTFLTKRIHSKVPPLWPE